MVANAGIIITKRLFEVSVEEWDRVQAVSGSVSSVCARSYLRLTRVPRSTSVESCCVIAKLVSDSNIAHEIERFVAAKNQD